MGICTRRHFVLTICILQLISTAERQVFDFLGTMWGPILANFFQIIFVIFGFFGTHQYRPKYVIAYSVWSALWIGWNIFIICFYLSVGVLDKNGDALSLGTGSVSWWEVNGYGCKPIYSTNITIEDPLRPIRPESVQGCLLTYEYVEILHAALQVALGVLGGCGGICVIKILMEEDDSSSSKKGGVRPASLYSIEYTPHPHETDRIDDRIDDQYTEEDDDESLDGNQRNHGTMSGVSRLPGPQLSPRPMTPRRVKRRSVNSRGTTLASGSGTLRGSSSSTNQHPPTLHRRHQGTSGGGTSARSSLRSSGRKNRSQPQHQNPVTRLLIQQQQQQLQSQIPPQIPPHSHLPPQIPPHMPPQLPQHNMRLGQTFKGLGDSSTSNESRPGFMESTSHTDLLLTQDAASAMVPLPGGHNWRKTGHVNPLYQQSSNQSLANNDDDDDSYNRPPSARSSYSNYHGARALGHLGPSNNYGQAAAQVPVVNSYRRSQNSARQSLRNAAFLNSGPPAYRSQGNLDSETVI